MPAARLRGDGRLCERGRSSTATRATERHRAVRPAATSYRRWAGAPADGTQWPQRSVPASWSSSHR